MTAAVAAGGSGYNVGDVLTILGGTFSSVAQLVVTSVGAGGAVTGVTIVPAGAYTTPPANPARVSDVTTPAALNATFTLTFGGVDTSTTQTFTLTVNFVNDQPNFTAINPPAINEDVTAPQTVNNWAAFLPSGGTPTDANEVGQTVVAYTVSNVSNPGLFAALPTVDTSGKLHYTLNPDVSGTTTFDVRVQDNGGTLNGGIDTSLPQTFTLTVNFVNDQPTFIASNPPAANEDSGAQTVGSWATFQASVEPNDPDPNEAGQSVLQYVVTNVTNTSLFVTQPAVDVSGALTYTLKPNVSGTSNFTLTVQDNGGRLLGGIDTSAPQTFTITVNFVNDKPSFTANNPPAINEDVTTPQVIPNWVTNFSPSGPPIDVNEAGQTVLQYLVNNVSNPSLFAVAPSISPSGALTYTLNPNVSGTSTFDVQVQDNGGTAFGGLDTSDPKRFTLTVNFINDRPSFLASNPPAANEDGGAQTVPHWATFEPSGSLPTDANEVGQNVKQYTVTNLSNPGLFTAPPSVDVNGQLTYTLKPLVFGSTTFDVRVQDDGGTLNTGIDSSLAQTFTLTVNFVNHAPTFTKGADQNVRLGVAGQTVSGWATAITAGPPNEASQKVTFTVTNDNNALFLVQPAVSPTGVLTYTPVLSTTGTANVTVVAHDNGGTANGGVDTSAGQTFVINVNADDSTVAVASSVAQAVVGQAVTFTATVRSKGPSALRPQGTVDFLIDGSAVSMGVPLVSGAATFSTAALLAVGSPHSVAVNFHDADGLFNDGAGNLPSGQVVNRAKTSTKVTSSQNPSIFGQAVTWTASVSPVAPGGGTPDGSVTFVVDGASQGSFNLDANGQATFSLSTLNVNTHTIVANYSGSLSYLVSGSSLTGGQVVQKPATSTALSPTFNPSRVNQPVVFTATVSAAGVTPTGTVTFSVDGVAKATVTLVNGQASYATTSLAVGNRNVVAAYNGSSNLRTSSDALTQVVKAAGSTASTAVVQTSGTPSVVTDQITFMATVSGAAGTPTGAVTFLVDGAGQGTFALDGGGQAQLVLSTLPVGNHTVKVAYYGDDTYKAANSAGIPQVVNKADTTTALSPTFNPSRVNQPVAFTALVSSALGTPTGTVTFWVDGVAKATVTLVNGQASYATSTLAVGNRSVVAKYSGTASTYAISSDTLTQVVKKAGTTAVTVAVQSSEAPSVVTDAVTFTATVSGIAGTPSGAVTFLIDNVSQGTFGLDGSGQAQFVANTLPVGKHSVVAVYYGDDTYKAANSPSFSQTVTKPLSSTALSSSATPTAVALTPTTFTAAVTTGNVTATGSVTFTIDGAAKATVTLSAGQAVYVTTSLTAGNHAVTATYNGNATFATSSDSLTQAVQAPGPNATTTSVESSVNPSTSDQAVTFTATVADQTGFNIPTGWVRFVVDNKLLPFTMLDANGQATITYQTLSGGTHPVYAVYSGDLTYAASTAATLFQSVNSTAPASTLIATVSQAGLNFVLTVSALTSTGTLANGYNEPVSFTVVSAPVGGAIIGNTTATFVNGVAVFPGLTRTMPGTYQIKIVSGNLLLFFTFASGGRLT
jgi:hypothetical protein